MFLNVCSYNHNSQGLGAGRAPYIQELINEYQFVMLQEHWLFNEQLGKLQTGADLDRVDSVFKCKKLQGLRPENGKLIDFLGDWNPVTVLLTGFQNPIDSLLFVVGQLGCFIDLKINAVTKRCERVG